MNTDDLIETLAAETRQAAPSISSIWRAAMGLAVVLAAAVFFMTLGPRPDIAAAAETTRFVFKFVITVALAISAFGLAHALSRPGENWCRFLPGLTVVPTLVAIAVAVELSVLPSKEWAATMIGRNSMACLISIPLIGIGPLATFLLALRHGAPTHPMRAGAVAGLLAGGIAATFYAAHCTDDSPLFVVVWYTIAIAGLALLGAAGGRRFARW